MNKELIKWMCGYAEGFEIIEYPNGYNHYRAPHREHSMEIEGLAMHLKCDKHEYSLLLQRAIEGVNRKTDYEIRQDYGRVEVHNTDNVESLLCDCVFVGMKRIYETPDQAKEAALQWVKDHE